ncbi:15-hydroxyprostaglandin dehydrogenase [Trichonephila clavipes]|nr:15-hydroxyprostaglandin dehydrogenase [Trichonephila clavipes]
MAFLHLSQLETGLLGVEVPECEENVDLDLQEVPVCDFRDSISNSESLIFFLKIQNLKQADGPTTLEQPTLNHVQSDTMASVILADPKRALQRTNRGSGAAMEESENDVGNLAGKLPLGDHLGKVLHGVEEY